MTLQKQLVHINISGNLERKDDSALVIPSKLTRADDVVFDDASTVIARGGQSKLPVNFTSQTDAIGEARRLFTNDGSLFLEHSNGIHALAANGARQVTYLSQPSSWGRVFRRAGMTTRHIATITPKAAEPGAGTPYYDGNLDSASSPQGVTCTAFETYSTNSSQLGIRIIITEADGTVLNDYRQSIITQFLQKPRVVWTGTTFFVYYASAAPAGTRYRIRRMGFAENGTLSHADAQVLETSILGAGTLDSIPAKFDLNFSATGSFLGLVYVDLDAAGTVYIIRLDSTDGLTILWNQQRVPTAAPTNVTCLAANLSGSAVVHAFFSIGTTSVRGMYSLAGTSVGLDTQVASGVIQSGRIAATVLSGSTDILLAYDDFSLSGATNTLRLSRITSTQTIVSQCASTLSRWFLAGGIAFVQGRYFLPMRYSASFSGSTHYVIDLSALADNLGTANTAPFVAVARIDYGEGIKRDSLLADLERRIPAMPVVGNTIVLPYLKYATDLVLAGTANVTYRTVSLATVDFASQLRDVEINGNTLLAGACPMLFDGQSLVEEGFHHPPEWTGTATGTVTAFGPFPVGTCTIAFTIGWQDDNGNWHESAPSNEAPVTFSAPAPYLNPTVYLPPTLKQNTVIRIYRTKASSTDTTLYLSRTPQGTFISTDSDLGAGEALYTTGDVLPNEPMPACRHLSIFQGRVVASGTEDGFVVSWSKETEKGYGVEFCSSDPLHRKRVPVSTGRVVGTQEVDDRLFVLCEKGVGIIYGTGPASTGLSGGYSDFNTIITETGCAWDSLKSIVRAPEGVWFRSPFGLRLVSRNGSLARSQDGKQVGAEVDELVSGNVVAVYGDAKQQIRFYQTAGTVLIWDYQWQKWTRFTGHANVDACFADNRFYHVNNVSSVAQIRYYNESVTRDANDSGTINSVYESVIETAWLQFAGIQGFQRIYRLMLLANYTSVSGAAVAQKYYYDFSTTADADQPSTLVNGTGAIQIQHHFVRQKCESLKIETRFYPLSSPAGRFRLTDLTLQVGVKPGYYKLPSSQRF